MPEDHWASGPEDEGCETGPGRGASRRFTESERRQVERLARNEITAAFREIGIEFDKFDKRQDIQQLFQWLRMRRASHEGTMSKLWAALIGAGASSIVAALAAMLAARGHL